MPRAVITGLGCISACGNGVETFWQALKSGRSAVGPINLERWLHHKIGISAQIRPEILDGLLDQERGRNLDRFSQLALIAANEAVAHSGLEAHEVSGPRTAVIVGSGVGGQISQEAAFLTVYRDPPGRLDPMTISRIMISAPASIIGMRHGVTGPTFVVSSACSSATQAIGIGASMVRCGVVDRAIVGGTESSIAPGIMRAWEAMRVLTPDACRPFSMGRNGMVIGEGAAMVILENADAAHARGAAPLAEFLGYGTTGDAGDMIRCSPIGAAAAMKLALSDAQIEPNRVNHINAHGTGTVLNDASEAEAIRIAFGNSAEQLSITSTKPIHGHALGATGALELIAAVMSVREDYAPPTLNWIERDPKCDLDIVANRGRSTQIDIAVSNSFAFGGINASLIVGKAM
jgi:nodulation protein E